MKEWMITYENFRGQKARAIVWAKDAPQAKEDFYRARKETARSIIKIQEQK